MWSKNTCNEYPLDILYPGPVKVDDWEYETVYVPVGFYGTLKDFARVFNKTVLDGILKNFGCTFAHPDTTDIPAYTMLEY